MKSDYEAVPEMQDGKQIGVTFKRRTWLDTVIETLALWGILLLIMVIVFGGIYLSYWIFEINHPGAPWWGWFLHE